jgi:hypothetical protein
MKRVSGWMCAGATLVALAATNGCRLGARVDTTGVGGDVGGAPGGAGGATASGGTTGGGPGGATDVPPDPYANQRCKNLECQASTCKGNGCKIPHCLGDAHTTISGRVFDPAGKVPLYNVAVYVPNAPLADFKDGPSCDPCDPNTGTSLLSGEPLVVTTTAVDGTFHLGAGQGLFDAPAGTSVPLVIQVGKWRRQITVPTVTACIDNPIADADQTRLPRTSAEGHIPKMALTTGGSDAMECLLRKVGIAESEFTPEAGAGRVNLYQGGAAAPVVVGMGMGPTAGAGAYGMGSDGTLLNNGAKFTPADPWWDSFDNLAKYDLVLHSCDGSGYDPKAVPPQAPNIPKSMAGRMALQKYADMGGRVFASHWHAYWFEQGTPAFQSIGTFFHRDGLPNLYNATIDQSFPKGKVFAQWMMNVGGSTTLGIVPIVQDASNRLIDAATGMNVSQRWIYASTYDPASVLFLSATTPVPGGTCGRVVITDLHVSAGGNALDTDKPKMPFPTGCLTKDLSAREKALEFMLFDIASCVQPSIK